MSNERLKQIKHIVVLMLENRSFDNMLGWLYDSGNPPPFNVVPPNFHGLSGQKWCNPLGDKEVCAGQEDVMTNPNPDPNEGYNYVYAEEFGVHPAPTTKDPIPNITTPPPMTGFANDYADAIKRYNKCRIFHRLKTKPQVIMNGFPPVNVPVISGLAYSYALCDHWFASAPTETFPNRSFVHAGTSSGYVYNTWDYGFLLNKTTTIYNLLENAGISWRIYYGSHLLFSDAYVCQEKLWPFATLDPGKNRFFQMEQFYKDAAAPAESTGPDFLPSYSFIEPRFISSLIYGPENDEHPPGDTPLDIGGYTNVLQGELLIYDIYQALVNSPNWNSTLFVIIYDEHGGCFDHVPPPASVKSPDDKVIPLNEPGGSGFVFNRLGVRVPAVLISPLIAPGTISNTVFDHTSVIRTAIECFGVQDGGQPATLLNREAHANYIDDSIITLTEPRPTTPSPPPSITPRQLPGVMATRQPPDKRRLTKFQRDLIKRAAHHLALRTGKQVDHRKIKSAEDANAALGEPGDALLRT